jgi:transcriptional regulator of acetoin/glycerol metabolism
VQLLEKRLFESEFADDILIAVHPRPEYIGSLQEGMLAASPDGRILGLNPVAREWISRSGVLGEAVDMGELFKLSLGAILDRCKAAPSSLLKLELRKGGQLFAQVRSQRSLILANPGGAGTAATQAEPASVGRATASPLRPAGSRREPTLEALATGDERQQRAVNRARRIGGKDIPLLIQGESGVGKELFARAFHNSSPRAGGPFVALNCAAIPENLIESELFGYAGGAFTGARREGAIGKVQQAHGGTLFLDEIGDMPLSMQSRLLRVLQERSVTPVGSMKTIPVDISLVCATHRVLREAVANGEFREDLYYRVNGLTITLPPLRERSDIASIVERILDSEVADSRDAPVMIGAEVMRFFEHYPWPGNIRQLQSVIRVAVALLDEDESEILPEHLPEELFGADPEAACALPPPAAAAPLPPPPEPVPPPAAPRSLDEIELDAIARVMREVGGNVSAAARRLGVSRNTLYRKLGRISAGQP